MRIKLLDRLERAIRPYAIHNITLYMVAAEGLTYFLDLAKPGFIDKLILSHDKVFAGEWWRLLALFVVPPRTDSYFVLIELFALYIMGTSLELKWGAARYNLFLLFGYLGTMAAVLVPHSHILNTYVNNSIVLAFGALFPDFQWMFLFLIPVKSKWFALLVWVYYVIAITTGDWGTVAAVGVAVANFLLFFHTELWEMARTSLRKSKGRMHRIQQRELDSQPRHTCATCGINDLTDRRAEFRYCPQCTGTPAYCLEHIANHEHK